MLEAALARGIDAVPDAPASLRALFESLENPPFEVDHDLIELGARALTRHAVGYSIATRQSLFWGYIEGAAVKPLAWTGALRTPEAAARRLVETGSWLQAVIAPGGVRRDGQGWHASVRVRLLHARVRANLRRSDRWDKDAWGAPLNQADTAYTLTEFQWMPLKLLRDLGFVYTPREIDGIYALWRYVGHLFGVVPELNCDGEIEAGRLVALRELTRGPVDQDSIELVRALLDTNLQPDGSRVQQRIGTLLEAFDRAVMWRHLPPGYTDALQVPPPPALASRFLDVCGFLVRLEERVRQRVPATNTWLTRRNAELLEFGNSALIQRVALARRGGHRTPRAARPAAA
jgi:hypothetical protein